MQLFALIQSHPFKRICQLLLLGAVILALGACSRSFGYRFADTYLTWQVRGYVSLERSQRRDVRDQINHLLQWHAEKEMPLYHSVMGELADDIQNNQLDEQRFYHYQSLLAERWYVVRAELLAPGLKLLPQLSESQVRELIRGMHERIDDAEKEATKELKDAAQSREEFLLERYVEQFERWFGDITAQQKTHLEAWVIELPDNDGLWFEYRRAWTDAFSAALALRDEPSAFAVELEPLIKNPEQLRSDALRHNMTLMDELTKPNIISLVAQLTTEQRAHFTDKLEGYRADLVRMARTRGVEITY